MRLSTEFSTCPLHLAFALRLLRPRNTRTLVCSGSDLRCLAVGERHHHVVFDDLLHKTLQNLVLGDNQEDLHGEANRHRPTSPLKKVPLLGKRWWILPSHRTPDPPCVSNNEPRIMALYRLEFAGRPTRNSQVFRSTRRSTIIGLDTAAPAVSWLTPSFTKTA